MSHGIRWSVWLRHGAVALCYALGYALLRQVSWSHWLLFTGYRLSVLLLVPYRYWPALVVGEMGPLTYVSLSCLESFGWVWSSLMLVPPIAVAMPVVKACRDRLNMIPARGPVRMGTVLVCTLVVSGLWSLMNLAALEAFISMNEKKKSPFLRDSYKFNRVFMFRPTIPPPRSVLVDNGELFEYGESLFGA